MRLHALNQRIHIGLQLHLFHGKLFYLRTVGRSLYGISRRKIRIRCIQSNCFRGIYGKVDHLVIHPQTIKLRRYRARLLESKRTVTFQLDRIQRNNTFQSRSFQIKRLAVSTGYFAFHFKFRFGITCAQAQSSQRYKKNLFHISCIFLKRTCKYTPFHG